MLCLLEYFCENCRTREGALIACSWRRWHTQHRSLWRLDLVTSCPFLVSWMHLAVGTKLSFVILRSLPSTTNVTIPRLAKSVSAVCSRKSATALSAFLPNFTSKIAAWENSFAFPFDSQRRRTWNVESILTWTDRSLSLAEWHPTKPQSSKQLHCVCRQTVRLCPQENMSTVVSPTFLV